MLKKILCKIGLHKWSGLLYLTCYSNDWKCLRCGKHKSELGIC